MNKWQAIAVASLLLAINMPLKIDAKPVAEIPPAVKARSVRLNVAGLLLDRNPQLGRSRALRISNAINRCVTAQNVPELTPKLLVAVIYQESAADPSAVSQKGAVGLMQVMPYMFASLGLSGNPAHIETNVHAGCTILADNLRRLGYPKGVAAYFWGNRVKGNRYHESVDRILRKIS